jgi:phage terminase large subunit-like protein
MVPASQRLYDAIVERRLVHGNDPQLNAHVSAAVARHGRRGWRVDKANRLGKIDAVIALTIARGPPRQRRPDRQPNPQHDPAVSRLPPRGDVSRHLISIP